MIKQLLATVAVAAMAFNASAEKTVLWTAESPEGEVYEGWHDFLTLSAEEAAVLNTGDILYVTATAKGETGWPQVALFEGGVGWPPMTNAGVGDVPCTVSMAISNDIAEKIHANGATIKGESLYISEIYYEKSTIEVGPYTVWFGPKQCNWGDPVSIAKEVFADVKAGDQIKVNYDKTAPEHTLQFLFGGWSGLNLPTYQVGDIDCMSIDEETGWITIDLTENLATFTWEEKEYDVFALLKEGGLIMQGPCLVNQVQFIPAPDDPSAVKAIESESAAEYYNLQGVKVANPVKGNIYIVKKGAKAVKAAF